MNKPVQRGIEAIAVKRATVADADKVRYRVYRTADDFVAVIAESALMAVKVSGITEPYRIVRDLPTEGVSLESERLSKTEKEDRVSLALKPKEKTVPVRMADLITTETESGATFRPMQLRDLQKSATLGRSILPADAVEAVAATPKPEPKVEAQPLPTAPSSEAVKPEATPEPAAAVAPVEEALSPDEVDKLLNS